VKINTYITVTVENITPKLFKTLPTVNNYPIGQNSPNLVTLKAAGRRQGCQMVCFQTKNPNLGKILTALDWKRLTYVFYVHLEYLFY
jgi:hypothetical protein